MLFSNPSSIVPGNFSLKLEVGNGHGSTNNYIRRFTNTISNTLTTYATYADSSTNGMSVTVLVAGWFTMCYVDWNDTVDTVFGVSINSNQLTTSIASITSANRLTMVGTPAANRTAFCGGRRYCVPGDVIRAHTNGNPNGVNLYTWFSVTYG